MLSEHFRTLARFNAWANNEVYDAVATLPAAEIGKPRPAAYFDSILGTLNHLLVVDLLWFGRVAGVDPGVTSLDQVLHEDFGVLRKARATEDARIIALVESLDETQLAADLSYRSMAGDACQMPLRIVLASVFNHQTHHRGQIHGLLKEAGARTPDLDIPVYWAEAG